MSIRDSFFEICDKVKPRESHYVSLYVSTPFYGGPEEGGWWGKDTELMAYQECISKEEAEQKKQKIEEYARELNKQSKRAFGERCQREMEWLEARGLDADFFPEVNGEEKYHVMIEEQPGMFESRGNRQYS